MNIFVVGVDTDGTWSIEGAFIRLTSALSLAERRGAWIYAMPLNESFPEEITIMDDEDLIEAGCKPTPEFLTKWVTRIGDKL